MQGGRKTMLKSALVVLLSALAVGMGIGVGQQLMGGDGGTPAVALEQDAALQEQVARGAGEEVIIRVARQVTPAVVGIAHAAGSGSGVIVREDGIILTNRHVVGNARQVEVSLADGRRVPGRVLGRDPFLDVAVVDVEGRNYPTARLGNSDRLQVGQAAIAIGNPLGLERSVTTGVVSAINRNAPALGLEGMIQTDAAIYPGNSGGPLLDSNGRVIGINTAVAVDPASYGVAAGLGFAVPINLAFDVVEQVLTTGVVRRAFLGINYEDVTPEIARYFGLPVEEGIVVTYVGPGTPAAQAGLRPGDIITRIGEVEVEQGGDLRRLLRERRPGEVLPVTVVRGDRRTQLRIRLGELALR